MHPSVGCRLGIGRLVGEVLREPDLLDDPYGTGERAWRATGFVAASNGGIMRRTALGIWEYWSTKAVCENAAAVCRITHADPRCVGSCVAVSVVLSALVSGDTNLPGVLDIAAHQVQA
ncbi:MAG: ADP-ribosylglycohydrolase family protein [Anaerolineae bacterium]